MIKKTVDGVACLEYSWDDYMNNVRLLDKKIQYVWGKEGQIPLAGIPRGGILVATLLSYLSPRYMLHSLEARIIPDEATPKFVIVDDILDTGKVREASAEWIWPEDIFAVLIDKGLPYVSRPSLAAETFETNVWVQFPYENLHDSREKESQKLRGFTG